MSPDRARHYPGLEVAGIRAICHGRPDDNQGGHCCHFSTVYYDGAIRKLKETDPRPARALSLSCAGPSVTDTGSTPTQSHLRPRETSVLFFPSLGTINTTAILFTSVTIARKTVGSLHSHGVIFIISRTAELKNWRKFCSRCSLQVFYSRMGCLRILLDVFIVNYIKNIRVQLLELWKILLNIFIWSNSVD